MDTTGNRRFFPIYINSIDLSYETLDKDYIWGYIMHLYLEGVSPILSPEEKAYQTRKNEEKRTQSTIEVILSDILQPKESGFVSSVQLVEALKEKGERVSNTRAIASVMQLLGYPSDVKKVNGKATRGYRGCTLEAIQPEYFEH
jgi:predicted P-loop ATPase